MKKPPWLKKADPNKPWKYKHTVQEGINKGLVIEPYNFNTPIGMDVDKIEEACQWIDEQTYAKSQETMQQRDKEPENRVMKKTTTIRDVRQHKDITVGSDGYDVFELSTKPVKVENGYELQKVWYLIPSSWRKVKAMKELR